MSTFTIFGAILISWCVLIGCSKIEEASDKSDKWVITYESKSGRKLSIKEALAIKDQIRMLTALVKDESNNKNKADIIKRFADKTGLCEKNEECLVIKPFSEFDDLYNYAGVNQ